MGQLKALLPWRGATLIQAQVAALEAGGVMPLVVVLGHRADELRELLPPFAHVVLNERYAEGKSTSIVAGVKALPANAEAAVVVAVDQPTESEVIHHLVDAYETSHPLVLLPSVNHRRGHPTLFDRSVFSELQAITEEKEGLREVMVRHELDIRYVNVDTPIVRANLNTPEDYEAAVARWGSVA